MDKNAWYVGFICKILDESNVKYQHCRTWFKLFTDNDCEKYHVIKCEQDKEIKDEFLFKQFKLDFMKHTNNRVVIRDRENNQIVFKGTLQDFSNWIQKFQSKLVM